MNEFSFNANVLQNLADKAVEVGLNLLAAILILIIGFKLIKFIEKRVSRGRGWSKIDTTLQSFLRSLMRIVLKGLVIIAAVIKAGVSTTTLVTILGAAGLAIGLALQGSLSNIAGGVLIIALRPFKVGDYIEGGGKSGTVSEISIFYTRLTTPDNRAVIVPNSEMSNSAITNYGYFSTRRLDLEFGVSYDASIEDVKRVISEVVAGESAILKTPEPFVRLGKHGDSALVFNVRVWVNGADYWNVNFDLQEKVKEALDQAGIEIPYPHMVLNTVSK